MATPMVKKITDESTKGTASLRTRTPAPPSPRHAEPYRWKLFRPAAAPARPPGSTSPRPSRPSAGSTPAQSSPPPGRSPRSSPPATPAASARLTTQRKPSTSLIRSCSYLRPMFTSHLVPVLPGLPALPALLLLPPPHRLPHRPRRRRRRQILHRLLARPCPIPFRRRPYSSEL